MTFSCVLVLCFLLCGDSAVLTISYFRWVPPALPSSRSPEREKESTFAAGRSRVRFSWILAEDFFPLSLYCKCFYSITRFICVFSQRVEVERTLTDSQRDEFEDMLRAQIGRAHV